MSFSLESSLRKTSFLVEAAAAGAILVFQLLFAGKNWRDTHERRKEVNEEVEFTSTFVCVHTGKVLSFRDWS